MKSFIMNSDFNSIRKKLLLVYFFNVTDIIFTYFLLSTGDFTEANFLLRGAIDNTWFTLFIKIVVTFVLILYLLKRMSTANLKQLKICNILINMLLIFYILINVSHIFWTIFYL